MIVRPFLHIALAGACLASVGCAALFPPTVESIRVDRLSPVDGVMDSAWDRAPTIQVIAEGNTQPGVLVPVTIRSMHTADAVAFLIQWPDPIAHRSYYQQVAGGGIEEERPDTPDDQLALKFNISGSQLSCMLAGKDITDDVWHWKAARSDPAGYAQDRLFIVERVRGGDPPAGPGQYEASNGAPVRVRWVEDAGDALIEVVPADSNGRGLPGFRLGAPTGSQADIRAKGIWSDGIWTLEMARSLDTGHEDDAVLRLDGKTKFSIAVFDASEGQVHANTRFLKLKFGRKK